jgi:hypothetical protein
MTQVQHRICLWLYMHITTKSSDETALGHFHENEYIWTQKHKIIRSSYSYIIYINSMVRNFIVVAVMAINGRNTNKQLM